MESGILLKYRSMESISNHIICIFMYAKSVKGSTFTYKSVNDCLTPIDNVFYLLNVQRLVLPPPQFYLFFLNMHKQQYSLTNRHLCYLLHLKIIQQHWVYRINRINCCQSFYYIMAIFIPHRNSIKLF